MVKDFKKRCMILGIRTRIIYDFLVIIQGSYMISLVSYKDRTKKSSMDSMKSYIILVWNQRNFNPGIFRESVVLFVAIKIRRLGVTWKSIMSHITRIQQQQSLGTVHL